MSTRRGARRHSMCFVRISRTRAVRIAVALLCAGPLARAGNDNGGTYIAADSWVYTALDRLAALGYIPSQISGVRPWTRRECRQQLLEAENNLRRSTPDPMIRGYIEALHTELDPTGAVLIDTVYSRATVAAGPVLNDSYHFGQTIRDDFGRPFGRGVMGIAGFSAHAEHGRFFAAVHGEQQHAPANPMTNLPLIARLDGIPIPPAQPAGATDRFRPLEAYAGVVLGNFAISAGKQSLYWGPGAEAPLSFSNNAEPTKNLRISTIAPLSLPGIFRRLGAVRGEFIIGKLGGHANTWRPWFNAQKISFKLTENLEMGFTRWSIFWGVGHPISAGSFFRNFASFTSPDAYSRMDPRDPGDRKAGFDFRYRVPHFRRWLTLYADSYSEDDPSPLAAPRRAAVSPGIWLTEVPGLPRLDVRADVASTDPLGSSHDGQYNYFNAQYRSGNTNYGYLLGNAAGRAGRALTARATYSFTARTRVEGSYRQQKISGEFLPGGGTQTDAAIRSTVRLAPRWVAGTTVQYERFWLPVLGGPRRNLAASVELTWEPRFDVFAPRK